MKFGSLGVRCHSRPHALARPSNGRVRYGLTLTEVLIAVTVTLVLMAVLVNAFRDISSQISDSRAILQMAGQLRSAAETIREDLRGVTVPVEPWVNPADGLGYFEQAEFTIVADDPNFFDPTAGPPTLNRPDNVLGDIDDVMMFTARSTTRPFRGRIRLADGSLTTIESPLAEIIIWTVLRDENGNGVLDRDIGEVLTVHRRTLLIRPDLNDDPVVFAAVGQVAGNNNLGAWYQNNDLSVHVSDVGLVANSLGDLSKREYRFAHTVATDANFLAGTITDIDATLFPYPINRNWLNALTLTGNFEGEDVLLSDAVAFDIKLFDPRALIYGDELFQATGIPKVALVPGDPAYETMILADVGNNNALDNMIDLGAYVNPGYLVQAAINNSLPALTTASDFSGLPQGKSQFGLAAIVTPTFSPLGYDTWPSHYESDGLNQDAAFVSAGVTYRDVDASQSPTNALIDEGSDGFDSPHDTPGSGALLGQQINGADDAAERETSPPYVAPLRGVEVMIRVVEPGSQQVRQTSVAVEFAK